MVGTSFSSKKPQKRLQHTPHGLSRETGKGALAPMVIGLVCAVTVLVLLWLAYTYA